PLRRHGVVEPGGPDRAVRAGRPVADPVGERLALRPAAQLVRAARTLRAAGRRAGRRAALDRRLPDGAAGQPRGPRLDPPAAAPAPRQTPQDPLLGRVVTPLTSAIGRMFGGGDPDEPLALARLACAVGDDGPHADVCAAVLEQLDLFREHIAPPPPGRPIPV